MSLISRALRALTESVSDTSSSKAAHSTTLGVETLGERTMPAVTATLVRHPSGWGENLVIQGDDQPDVITMNQLSQWGRFEIIVRDPGGDNVRVPTGAWDVTNFGAWRTTWLRDITINGGKGNDTIRLFLNGGGSGTTTIDGGEGDDILTYSNPGYLSSCTLIGGSGRDLLWGGTGTDVLFGDFKVPGSGEGNDILIGGAGSDELHGGGGEDILIGGQVWTGATPDQQFQQLLKVKNQWDTTADYSTRVTLMSLPNLGYFGWSGLSLYTVVNDTDRDVMFGDGGRDWFFTDGNLDGIKDLPDGYETKTRYLF